MSQEGGQDWDYDESGRPLPWDMLKPQEQRDFMSWFDKKSGFRLHNVQMEQALLGAVLIDNAHMLALRDVTPEHFFEPLHQELYEAMLSEQMKGRSFSPVSLRTSHPDLVDRYPDTDVGQYLSAMAGAAIYVVSVRDYSSHIVELWARRRMAESCIAAIRELQNPGKHDLRGVTTKLVGKLMDSADVIDTVKVESMRKVNSAIVERLDDRSDSFSTRIACLDKGLGGGLYTRKSYCFMARPKNGKTILMSTIFWNMVEQGVPVLYIACEMGSIEIHQRNMARAIGVSSLRFITHKSDTDFIGKVLRYQAEHENDTGFFADSAGITFDELRLLVTASITRFGIKGIFLDYLGLVQGKAARENTSEHQEKVATWLAAVAKKHDIFCVYAAQTNREGHLRGSDAAMMNADVLYEITLEAAREDGTARMGFLTCHAHRYMPMRNIGKPDNPSLRLHRNGPHFKDSRDEADGVTVEFSAGELSEE